MKSMYLKRHDFLLNVFKQSNLLLNCPTSKKKYSIWWLNLTIPRFENETKSLNIINIQLTWAFPITQGTFATTWDGGIIEII